LNTEAVIKVELSGESQTVNVRFNSRLDDIDMKNDFDLAKGNHLQFAMVDDQLRVAQRSDKKFPDIPFQFKKKNEEENTTSNNNTSNSSSKETEVVFYLKNAQASFVKKLVIKIDGKVFHTVSASIPVNQVYIVSGTFQKPKSGDLVLKVDIKMPSKGFYDSIEEEFNITKHGGFILVEVTDEKTEDGKGGYNWESSIQFANQHKPFVFE
jgi:hypothetical protein